MLKKSSKVSEKKIGEPLERSPVSNLQESINLAINLQATNLRLIVDGQTPQIPIDIKVWDNVLKMVEIMPKLELFERIVNGETVSEAKISQKNEMDAAENEETTGNSFEERSKVVKAKINGKTTISS